MLQIQCYNIVEFVKLWYSVTMMSPGGGGGGGSLPLEAVPDAREKKRVTRVYPNHGWARNAKRVSKTRKMGENGIQIAMIRILAMRSNVERVSNLRQHVH